MYNDEKFKAWKRFKKIENNIIKNVRNLSRLKKEMNDTATKDMRNLFRLKKENKSIKSRATGDVGNLFRLKKDKKPIKNRVIRDIRNLFEHEKEEKYYNPVRVGNFWSNNYTGYESNSDRNKTLLAEEYRDEIRPYLKDIINNLKKFDTEKIQWTIAINFLSSNENDEEHVMHSKSDSIEIFINDKADEVIAEFFQSLFSQNQIGLETSMKGSDFIFDCVHLLYYKCHKINLKEVDHI